MIRSGYICRTVAVVFTLTVLLVSAVNAETDAVPVRLFAEAEDFTVVSGDWEVVPYRENYFASTFAMTFLSRMALLGAPEQSPADTPAVAEQAIVIPQAGDYEVLARYEQPYAFSVEFTVEVEQNGKVVYSKVYGRLEDEKIWGCMGSPEARRTPMARFMWGGGDNIVWQHFETVSLLSGAATLRLIAGPQMDGDQLRRQAARRHVDLLLLTNDTAGREAQKHFARHRTYLEMDGWLVQDGDFFVRFTNPEDAGKAVVPRLVPNHAQGIHSPFAVHLHTSPQEIRVYRNGYEEIPRPRARDALPFQNAGPRSLAVSAEHKAPLLGADDPKEPLAPGASSGWIPAGHLIDAKHVSKWQLRLPQPMTVEFARSDGQGGLRPIRAMTLSGVTMFEMPGVIAPNSTLEAYLEAVGRPAVLQTQDERMQWLIDQVKAFPPKGKRPERFLIYKLMGWGGGNRDDGRELALLLGDNTTYDKGNKRDIITHWRNPDPAVLAGQIENHPDFDDVLIVSYGDEHHIPFRNVTDDEFATFLKQHAPAYDGPVAVTADRWDPLFYHSRLAAFHKGTTEFAAGTAFLGERGVLTGVNYSPHGNYLVTEHNYIRAFKYRALTMPWSEDYIWQVPEFSVQVMGYLTTAFRAGAKYDDMPIHMYVMPHSPGNTPRSFRLSFYTTIAHGSKMINYFCASPLAVGGSENYVATDDIPMWRAIHDCTHEAGIFEDYVVDGSVRRARVGLVLSSVDDLRGQVINSRLAVHNNERKAIYYALRHAQAPVDMLSEDDVIDGLADDYDLIYLTQRWAHSRFIEALEAWVERGGTLVALAGGGFFDEFNEPNPRAAALYGVIDQDMREDPNLLDIIDVPDMTFLSKQDLPRYEPFDAVTWEIDGVRVENTGVMIWRQALTAADDADVLGTFRDGTPAVVSQRHGKGRAILFGFLPGQAYLKSGLPLRPVDRGSSDRNYTHYLPTTMDRELRNALVDGFLPADFARPVICSVDLVESAVIDTTESRRRWLPGRPRERLVKTAVPLMNYTGKPIPELVVRLPGIERARAVSSVEQGELTPSYDGGDMILNLPIDITDMILIDF